MINNQAENFSFFNMKLRIFLSESVVAPSTKDLIQSSLNGKKTQIKNL